MQNFPPNTLPRPAATRDRTRSRQSVFSRSFIETATHSRVATLATLLLAGILFNLPPEAPAAEAPLPSEPASPTVELDPHEVFADRVPAADNSELEARRLVSPESFTGVTREEFGRRANRRAGDIVARLPGVYMGGPPGENKDARLRGLDKEFTRTQVDGLPIPDGGEKRELQLNRVPADLVQEVRILRNPSPEFESDGLAGRLDFRFRTIPDTPFTGEIRAAAGRRSTADDNRYTATLLLGGRLTDQLGALGSFTWLDDPFVKEKYENEYTPSGDLKKAKTETEAIANAARDFFGDVAWNYSGAGTLHLKPLRLETIEDKTKTKIEIDPGKPADADETRTIETERKTKLGQGLSLAHIHTFGTSGAILDSRLSWQRLTESKGDKTAEAWKEKGGAFALDKTTTENEDKQDRTLSFDTRATLPLGADRTHLVKTGLAFRTRDRYRDKTKFELKTGADTPTEITEPKDTYFLDEDYYAAFIQDYWTITPTFTALYGARFERVHLATRTRDTDDVDNTFNDFNPALQLAWRTRPDTTLKFAVSRALNRPKFDELSPYRKDDKDKITIGNPALDPARAWKADVGIDFSRRKLFLSANLFAQDITGVIESVETGEIIDGKPVYQVLNVGDGWVRGIELEQRLSFLWSDNRLLSGLTLWANQTWLRSELTEAATGISRPFSGQPRFLANLGIDYQIGWLYFTISARHIGERPGDEASADVKTQTAENPIDAAIHLRLAHGLTAFVEVNNLTDEGKLETTWKADGSSVIKSENTGRAWFAGVHYRF